MAAPRIEFSHDISDVLFWSEDTTPNLCATTKPAASAPSVLPYNKHNPTENMTAQDKVKDTVREEAQRVANLASDAAQSGAYLYPIRVWISFPMRSSSQY